MLCELCPRECKVDRSLTKGFCHESEKIRIAKVIENFCWEEPCLCGKKGALAIFFSGCNLRCQFCQNYEISHIGKGQCYSQQEFVEFLKSFDYSKFDSVDLITPTQFSAQIVEALKIFKPPLPIIWNSSGYETEKMIKLVAEYVDIFLVDLKFHSSSLSQTLAGAGNYFEVASKAIKLMSKLKSIVFQKDMMKQGVIIRHLILPGYVRDSLALLQFVAQEIENPIISLMSQFTPNGRGEPIRKLTPLEHKIVLSYAQRLGLKQGYFQDLDSADDKFIPKF